VRSKSTNPTSGPGCLGQDHGVWDLPAGRQGVYTEIIPDCARRTLLAIIRGRIEPDSIIYSDHWRGYSGLVDLGYKKHYRVHHGKNEFANGRRHIDGIGSFWSYAKGRLTKFRGVPRSTFYLHLKECEIQLSEPEYL
jgi:transposase-like protein